MDLGSFFNEGFHPAVEQKPWMLDCVMELVTPENLTRIMDECAAAEYYALDLETTGLNNRVYNGRTKDTIVGVCLSPDGMHGYYAPLRHIKPGGDPYDCNIPMSVWEPEFLRLLASPARAVFHHGKFDQEFLDHATGGAPWGNWADTNTWDDTLILAYLRNTRERRKGLKHLSEVDLKKEMIELKELFPLDKRKGPLNFSTLDPTEPAVLWYGASDGICTWLLYELLAKQVLGQAMHNQRFTYNLEKKTSVATRWMERNGIPIDLPKVKELITLGQTELLEAIALTYKELNAALGRKVTPPYIKHAIVNRVLGDPDNNFKTQLDEAKGFVARSGLDRVPSYTDAAGKEWLGVYDILSPKQLGMAMLECDIPDLPLTGKSKQVDTSRATMELTTDKWGKKYPFLLRIRRVRELLKALSTYLLPLWNDTDRITGTIKVSFNGTKTDTGRFSTPSGRPDHGGTTFFLQGMPASYVKDRPECMLRLRECIGTRDENKFLVAIDFSGVELRLATNLSGEPMWLKEYFRCSDCDTKFPSGDGKSTPPLPPPHCPTCGGDKIGDIHTLTALNVYGPEAKGEEGWKEKRQNAKGANFALLYGGSANAVQRSTDCDKNEAYRIKRQFDSSYTVMTGWWKRQYRFARDHNYVVTAFGRRYPLPDINLPPRDPKTSRNNGGFIAKAERNSVNGPIQGSSADITKMAMWLCYRLVKARGWEKKLLMTITMHDELVFEIDRDILELAIELICDLMTRNKAILAKRWPVPLQVDTDIGKTWAASWNLNAVRQSGVWPEELKPWFTGLPAPEPPAPEAAVAAAPVAATGGAPAAPVAGAAPPVVVAPKVAMPAGVCAYTYTLRRPLGVGLINNVAECIVGAKGPQPLFLRDMGGQELAWPNGTVLVDAVQFEALAKHYKV